MAHSSPQLQLYEPTMLRGGLQTKLIYSLKLKPVKKLESAARGGLLKNTDQKDKRICRRLREAS